MGYEYISGVAYTQALETPNLDRFKAILIQHLEEIRELLPDGLDEDEYLTNTEADEYGFDPDGFDVLYDTLVHGYSTLLNPRVTVRSFRIGQSDRWFTEMIHPNDSGDDFDGHHDLRLLLFACTALPTFAERIGLYGFGILPEQKVVEHV